MAINPSIPPAIPPATAAASPSTPKTYTRVNVQESGPANAKEVTLQQQAVRIQDSASNKVQALRAVRQLEHQIDEAELTLKAIQFTKELVALSSWSGKIPTLASIRKDLEKNNVPPKVQKEIFKVYAYVVGTLGKPNEVTAENLKALAKTQFEYSSALREAHSKISAQLPEMKSVTDESAAESAAFAKTYLSDPKNKFLGENGILAQMEEGDRITLSRRKLSELGQGTIPHSVIIIKDRTFPEGYRFFFTPHDQDLERTVALDKASKKGIAAGSYNKVSRLASREGSNAINRQPKIKGGNTKIDEIREAKVIEHMKGKSHYVATPIGTEPRKGTQQKIKPLLAGTAFKMIPGQIMEKFSGGDGEGYIGFNIKTNSSTKVPSAEVGLQLIDSMTHAFADLHANHIYQLDVKLQNTGVFESIVEGKTKVTMVLHDFGQAANLSHPTLDPALEFDETTAISVFGTPLYMSPEQAGTAVEQQKELDVLNRDLEDPAKDKAETQRKIDALLQKTYSQMDCYSMALNAFTIMTGKLPSHLYEINQPRVVKGKEQAATPGRILSDVCEIKLDIDPDNALGSKIKEEFTADAKARGYDEQLITLVLKGLNTDASKRPSAADFQVYFAAKRTS